MSSNFNGFFDNVNNNSVIAYQKFLIDNMIAAFEVVFRNVNSQSFTAIPNHCHDNVEDYCIINPNCKKIEGWLCIAYPDSPFTTIASHSIVLLENGEYIDITPTEFQQPSKFLPAFLESSQYTKLVYYLFENTGQTIMFVRNP